MRELIAAMALGLVFLSTAEAEPREEIYPGLKYVSETRSGPVEVRVVEVNLCAPGVSLRATRADESPLATSAFGALMEAEVAINGGFYEPDYSPTGLSMGDGEKWSDDIEAHGFIAFGEGRAMISSPREWVSPVPEWVNDAVGGYDTVVVDGEVAERTQAFCKARHPRTAVGLSENGATLYLVVVDGRSEKSIGMTCRELGELMLDLGAYKALNLDGGGSTTMWIKERGLVNSPSVGMERTVSNHLAIYATGAGDAVSCPASWSGKDEEQVVVAGESEPNFGVGPEFFLDESEDHEEVQTSRCGSVVGDPAMSIFLVLIAIAVLRQRHVAGGQSPRMSE